MPLETKTGQTQSPVDHSAAREYYDGVYHKKTCDKRDLSNHCRRLAQRFQPWQGKRLLDVGCGSGTWLTAVARLGGKPAGVDLSQVAIDACRRKLPDAELYCVPAEQLPFADRQFDFISCLGSLEHFISPEAALREMVRVAKPDSTLLILVPNAGFLPRRLGLYSGTQQAELREEVRSLQEWQEMFAYAGLEVVRRWRDLHVLSWSWIFRGPWYVWPLRSVQALALPLWPLSWQYQVYHHCALLK
jgi:ubiquinone/menaquinone biosynthesis C-methylase UbiE